MQLQIDPHVCMWRWHLEEEELKTRQGCADTLTVWKRQIGAFVSHNQTLSCRKSQTKILMALATQLFPKTRLFQEEMIITKRELWSYLKAACSDLGLILSPAVGVHASTFSKKQLSVHNNFKWCVDTWTWIIKDQTFGLFEKSPPPNCHKWII